MPYGIRPRNGHGRPTPRYRYAPQYCNASQYRYAPHPRYAPGYHRAPNPRYAPGFGYFHESKRDNERAAAVALPFLIAWSISPLLLWAVLGAIFLVGLLDPLVQRERAARRRGLAAAARAQKALRVTHRASRREPPSRERLLRCWELSRESLEGKILLGSLLGDADAAVDHSYIRGDNGEIVGRRGGVRRWLDATCPELGRYYKTLMRYKALADKFRRVCGLGDPDGAEDALAPAAPGASAISDFRSQISGFPPTPPARLAAARRKARELLAAHRTAKALDDTLWAALGLVRTRRRPAAA